MSEGAPGAGQLDLALRVEHVRLPRDLRPMLPVDAPGPFDSPLHLFDAWWGGLRVLAFVEEGEARLVDEHGRDRTDELSDIAAALAALPARSLLLDGEVVARPTSGASPDDAPWSDGRLDASREASPRRPAAFVAQDLLVVDGRSLVAAPLDRRRAALAAAIPLGEAVAVADPVPADGMELLEAVAALGLPGVVAKRRDSPYLAGVRSRLWLRVRTPERLAAATPLGPVPRSRRDDGAVAVDAAPPALRRTLVVLRGLPFGERA